MKKITLGLIFVLLATTYSQAQLIISATSSGFTRENSVADNSTNGSFSYQNLPIKRPSWNANNVEGRIAYFNFDYSALSGETITDAQLDLTFSSITSPGTDGGFTLVLKAYVEDTNSLPLEPNMDPYDFTGYTEYSIAEKVYSGGGDYPTAGTVVTFDVKQFLTDRLAESTPKTKALFELSIKPRIPDNTFFGNIASHLNPENSYRPILTVTGPSLSLNELNKDSFGIFKNNDVLEIRFKESDVDFQILNMYGQVLNSRLNANSSVFFDVSGFSSGMYIIRATNKFSFYSAKVILNN